MPAYVKPVGLVGVKWCHLFFDQKLGVPTVWGTVILNDPETGLPCAIMDGTSITNSRTGGHAAVAAKYLSRPSASSIAIIGCGAEGRTHLQAVKEVRPTLTEVKLFDIREEVMNSFAKDVSQEMSAEFVKCKSAQEAVKSVDIVCMTTTAQKPVVTHDWIGEGCFVTGSYSFNDLDPTLSKTADKWVLGCWESDEHRIIDHPGRPLSMPVSKQDVYADLGDIIVGRKPGRENDRERIVYTHLIGAADWSFAKSEKSSVKARFAEGDNVAALGVSAARTTGRRCVELALMLLAGARQQRGIVDSDLKYKPVAQRLARL